MEEIKKELTELKVLVSRLLEMKMFEHKMKYGYLDRPLNGSTKQKQISTEDIDYLKRISNKAIEGFEECEQKSKEEEKIKCTAIELKELIKKEQTEGKSECSIDELISRLSESIYNEMLAICDSLAKD